MNINQMVIRARADVERLKTELRTLIEGKNDLTDAEAKRSQELTRKLDIARGKLAEAEQVQAEEADFDHRAAEVHPTGAAPLTRATADVRVTREPRTYSKDNDPQVKGGQFLGDVAAAYRGNPQANERLARHMREYEVDNPRYAERTAGYADSTNFPNLVVPQYLVDQYAAKPSNARPFADICRHIDLPSQGMKVELAKGNTTTTAALQASELTAAGGGNFDADPLELSVQTAEAWQLLSRQAIERGTVTDEVVMNDMLDQMHALIDSTLLTQATTGLYDSGTRITYDSASPTMAELYPYILQGASKVSQTLLNRGRATHVLMHPRRWYWLQSLVASTWPQITQPGMDPQALGVNTGAGYNEGIAGVLPCGLQVVMDNNIQTAALAGAQTGGTQDILFVVPQNECILLEAPQREVFIRAEAPSANQLGVLLVAYEYFTYTFSRYAATAMQRINGTGTVPPAGF